MRFLPTLCLLVACGRSHSSMETDAGSDVLDPCPDFSCEARCLGVSVCDCSTPQGAAICESIRYGVCVGNECCTSGTCATIDPDAGVGADAEVETDADVDASLPDVGPMAPTSGVPCGGVHCEAPIAVCVMCPHEDEVTDSHCLPADFGEEWPFRTAMESHPFCGFPGLFIQCDGPEDCAREDQECVFQGGEWGYAQCMSPVGGPFLVACRSDADCDPGVRCGEIDPFGYFSPHFERLGWRPYACGGASADASAFCDAWDAACSEFSGPFYDRAQCLRTFDETWDAADLECARDHVFRGACAEAAASSPCDA